MSGIDEAVAALEGHLVIIRAKLLLAEQRGISNVSALRVLRDYALEHELALVHVARRYVAGDLTI